MGQGHADANMNVHGGGSVGVDAPGLASPDVVCLSDPGACGCPEQKGASGGWVGTVLSSGRPRRTLRSGPCWERSPVTWALFND